MTERKTLPLLTDRLALGADGLQVSPFCLGVVFDPNTVLAAFDAGINFFFVTADMHWPVYRSLRKGLAMLFARGGNIREQVVVGAVSYSTQLEFCTMPFAEVVEELPGLGHLDLLIAGGAKNGEYFERQPIYQHHLSSSYVGCRATGASFHIRQTALTAVNHSMLDIAFIRYNAGHQGANEDLFPLVKPHPRPLLYNFINTHGRPNDEQWAKLQLDDDFWRPEFADYYRFVLTRPALDGVLLSLGHPAQVKDLSRALEEGPLTPEEEEHLVNLAGMIQGTTRLKTAAERDEA